MDAHCLIAAWRKPERQRFIRSFGKEGHHDEILEKGAVGDGVDPHGVLVRDGNHPMLVRKPDGISCSQVNRPILPFHQLIGIGLIKPIIKRKDHHPPAILAELPAEQRRCRPETRVAKGIDGVQGPAGHPSAVIHRRQNTSRSRAMQAADALPTIAAGNLLGQIQGSFPEALQVEKGQSLLVVSVSKKPAPAQESHGAHAGHDRRRHGRPIPRIHCENINSAALCRHRQKRSIGAYRHGVIGDHPVVHELMNRSSRPPVPDHRSPSESNHEIAIGANAIRNPFDGRDRLRMPDGNEGLVRDLRRSEIAPLA